MGVRQRLEDKIRRKEQELQETEAQARDLRNYLQGLQDTLKMLPRGDNGGGDTSGSVTLRANSGPALAQEYLKQAGGSKHISEILKGIGREVNRQSRTGLAGSLNNYARKGVIFTAEGSNVFGLISASKEAAKGHKPPEKFGLLDDADETDDDLVRVGDLM